jgi:hypothetical protein
VLFLVLTIGVDVMAVAMNHHSTKDDSWVLAMIGMLAMVFVCFRSFCAIRFEPECLRYGLGCRKQVRYSEITELERVSTGKDVDFIWVLRSGKRVCIGSDLPREILLSEELQKRSGCVIPKLSRQFPMT